MDALPNSLRNKSVKIALTLLVAVSVAGCENGGNGRGPVDPPPYIPSAEGGTDGPGGPSGAGATALDCTNLDPAKVYFFGTLGGFDTYAIADALDPTSYCVGFTDELKFGVATEDGKLVYRQDDVQGNSLYTMVPDILTKSGTRWSYPLDASSNDALLLADADTDLLASILQVRINRSNGDVFYNSGGNVKREGELYRASASLVAAFDDESILIQDGDQLLLVYPDLTEAVIALPDSFADATSVTFQRARLYTDSASGAQAVWLAMGYVDAANNFSVRRWSMDPSALIAVDEGAFAPAPADSGIDGFALDDLSLDGAGNLWEAYSNRIIVRRPLSGTAQVVYSLDDPRNSEGSWLDTDTHFIRFSGSSAGFITGM